MALVRLYSNALRGSFRHHPHRPLSYSLLLRDELSHQLFYNFVFTFSATASQYVCYGNGGAYYLLSIAQYCRRKRYDLHSSLFLIPQRSLYFSTSLPQSEVLMANVFKLAHWGFTTALATVIVQKSNFRNVAN